VETFAYGHRTGPCYRPLIPPLGLVDIREARPHLAQALSRPGPRLERALVGQSKFLVCLRRLAELAKRRGQVVVSLGPLWVKPDRLTKLRPFQFEVATQDVYVATPDRLRGVRYLESLAGENLLRPVERQVIGILAGDDVRQQPRRCQEALDQRVDSRPREICGFSPAASHCA